MQKIKYILISLNMVMATLAMAQCPFGNGTRTNCQYGCGMYTDDNNDGYCDNSIVNIDRASEADTSETIADEPESDVAAAPKVNAPTARQAAVPSIENEKDSVIIAEIPAAAQKVSSRASTSKKYHFWLITLLTLGLYALSFLLMKTGCLPKVYHRRIWNVLLLIVGLVSCVLGFILVIHLNYHFLGAGYITFLRCHVEAGIAMTIIALFHIAWHWQYYKHIFTKVKQ